MVKNPVKRSKTNSKPASVKPDHAALKPDPEAAMRRFKSMPKPVRILYGRPRTFIALAIGLASLVIFPSSFRLASRLLWAWDIFVALYIAFAVATFFNCNTSRIRREAALQDDGRFVILAIVALGAFASLAAIVLELGIQPRQPLSVVTAITTIVLTWFVIHTTFALNYAHDYYGGDGTKGGLDFPGGLEPDYWDFVYFSFIIGMTAQTSDTGIKDKIMRRTATAHGVVSFFFNTALLALTINIAASSI